MDKKKSIIIILLIIICIIVGYIGYQTFLSPKDNVVEIDNITFNTTYKTDFKLHNETEYSKFYLSETKDERYTVTTYTLDYGDIGSFSMASFPSQTIDGIVVYTRSANSGKHIGEPTYNAIVTNNDINKGVVVGSSDPKETAKMASSLKFNN